MVNYGELMTAGDAQEYLGVSRSRMSRLLKEMEVFRKEENLRIKWVQRSEVEALKRRLSEPRPLSKKLTPAA